MWDIFPHQRIIRNDEFPAQPLRADIVPTYAKEIGP